MGIVWRDIHRAYWIGDKLDRGVPLDSEDIKWLIRQKRKQMFYTAVQAAAAFALAVFIVVMSFF